MEDLMRRCELFEALSPSIRDYYCQFWIKYGACLYAVLQGLLTHAQACCATASALSTHPFNYIQERNNSALCRVKNYYSMRWITRLVDRWRTQQTVRPSLNCRHFDGRHFERILRYRVFSRYHACLRVGLLKAIAFLSAKCSELHSHVMWLLYV